MIITFIHRSLSAALSNVATHAHSINVIKHRGFWIVTATYGAPLSC